MTGKFIANPKADECDPLDMLRITDVALRNVKIIPRKLIDTKTSLFIGFDTSGKVNMLTIENPEGIAQELGLLDVPMLIREELDTQIISMSTMYDSVTQTSKIRDRYNKPTENQVFQLNIKFNPINFIKLTPHRDRTSQIKNVHEKAKDTAEKKIYIKAPHLSVEEVSAFILKYAIRNSNITNLIDYISI